MEYIIKGITLIHFKTGASLEGDLSDFVFCEDTKAMIRLLSNTEKMKEYSKRDISVINLMEVSFLDIKEIRILSNDS
jgi:hypothetical protein